MGLRAGAAAVEVTPGWPIHLAGYPHVERISTGVHDPLYASALYLEAGGVKQLVIGNDVIYVPFASARRLKRRLSELTGVGEEGILISATHTHSGPKMLDPLATSGDTATPRTDERYVAYWEERVVEAGVAAVRNAVSAEIGFGTCDAEGVGTNRRNPNGVKDLEVPVVVVRRVSDHVAVGAMVVCCMHPTVMHEDSTLVSGDFPGMARKYLQDKVLGPECVVVYHTGPAGNQSPRHVVTGPTFSEAERLGRIVGKAVEGAVTQMTFASEVRLGARVGRVTLPVREVPGEGEARVKLEGAVRRLEELKKAGAGRAQVRTAEVDVFGAEETVTLAKAAREGRLAEAARSCMPAEVQVLVVGPQRFVAWPGEMFVEFGVEVKRRWPGSFCISYANGELQGYLVTREAVVEGGYEASNAIFRSPEAGEMLVEVAGRLIGEEEAGVR